MFISQKGKLVRGADIRKNVEHCDPSIIRSLRVGEVVEASEKAQIRADWQS